MAYTIIKSDGTVLTTIADGTLNTTSTSIKLPGRNFAGYGTYFDTNFVWMVENFAALTPPANPLRGQLWFNTNDNNLYVCPADGTTDPNDWVKLAVAEGNVDVTYGNITATGNINANNVNAVNSITANIVQAAEFVNGTSNISIPTSGNINLSVNGNANVVVVTDTDVNVTGTLTATNVSGNGAALSSITGANVIGAVSSATTANTVTTAAQPNITSVGTLSSLTVTGTANVGGVISLAGSGGAILTGPGLLGSGAGGLLRMISSGNAAFIQSGIYNTANSAAPLRFTTIAGGREWMRLDENGNLGVNITSPTSTLHVAGTANITGNLTAITNGFTIGYLNVPQVILSANSILALSDAGKHYYSTSGTELTLTIPDSTSINWTIGTEIQIINSGTANIQVLRGTGVDLYFSGNSASANRTLGSYGTATLLNVAANKWFIQGSSLT